jgi:hypothetical protein
MLVDGLPIVGCDGRFGSGGRVVDVGGATGGNVVGGGKGRSVVGGGGATCFRRGFEIRTVTILVLMIVVDVAGVGSVVRTG